jgi:transcriptional regulator with XRE-family HTH domain
MLGKILRDIRMFNEITLTELSSEFKLSQGYLSEIELGKKEPTLEVIQKYSEKFNVPVSAMMFFIEHKNEPEAIKSFRKFVSGKVSKLFDYLLLKNCDG